MSIDATFRAKLAKRIAEEKERAVATVMSGQCADHSTYRYSCGYMRALTDIETIIAEIDTELRSA